MAKSADASGISGNDTPAPGDDPPLSTFGAMRQAACRDLTSVTVRLEQRCAQAAADFRRTMMSVQSEAQSAQEGIGRDYVAAMKTGADAPEVAKRCNEAMDGARQKAQSRSTAAAEEANRMVAQSIEEANAGWDAACAGYIAALKARVAEIDPASPDAQALAAAAEGLGWIAMRVKGKAPH